MYKGQKKALKPCIKEPLWSWMNMGLYLWGTSLGKSPTHGSFLATDGIQGKAKRGQYSLLQFLSTAEGTMGNEVSCSTQSLLANRTRYQRGLWVQYQLLSHVPSLSAQFMQESKRIHSVEVNSSLLCHSKFSCFCAFERMHGIQSNKGLNQQF